MLRQVIRQLLICAKKTTTEREIHRKGGLRRNLQFTSGSLEYFSFFCLQVYAEKVSSAFLYGDDIVLVSMPFTDPHCRITSSLLLFSAYCSLFPKDPYY